MCHPARFFSNLVGISFGVMFSKTPTRSKKTLQVDSYSQFTQMYVFQLKNHFFDYGKI